MKKLFLAVIFLLAIKGIGNCDSLFSKERVYITSFTKTADTGVSITSAPVILRAVVFATTNTVGTVYFYDSQNLTPTTSTAAAVAKSEDLFSVRFSSGFMYTKTGTDPVTIFYDYTIRPAYSYK